MAAVSDPIQPVDRQDDLVPMSHSRRDSVPPTSELAPFNASPGAPSSAAAQAGLVPRPQSLAENTGLDIPEEPTEQSDGDTNHLSPANPQSNITTIYVGKNRKAFDVPTATLVDKSPYFQKLITEDTGHAGTMGSTEQTTFPKLDEFAMGLFLRWIQTSKLQGPYDFHSLAHYLSLYVLAKKFEIETLENKGKLHLPSMFDWKLC